jgi:CubicO group peptidase (beta-lactamase class C family)
MDAVDDLAETIDQVVAECGFSGVVRVDRGDEVLLAAAYGLAHRGHDIANRLETQFGIASGTKGFTALAVVSLVEAGLLDLSTPARSVLGDDLPLVDDTVTVEQLLAHRSGIGDYFDEGLGHDILDYVLPVPVYELATTEQYLRVLDGPVAKSEPGERFCYCNSGYVILALIAERVAGMAFADVVTQRVIGPAGMTATSFLRSDELPGRAAIGYLSIDGLRTNVLHLPVRGSGDGGLYSTVADLQAFWEAFVAGRIVSSTWVAEMVRPRSSGPGESLRYGLGFWLHLTTDGVLLEGADAGVSFRTVHDPDDGLTYTVVSNWTDGAWPVARYLENRFA